MSCVPAQPQLCKLPLFQSLTIGLGGDVCAWDSGVMRDLPQLSVFSLTCPTDPKEACSFATLSQAVFSHHYHMWLFGCQLRQHVLEWVSLPSFTGAIGRADCKQIFTAPVWTDVKQCPMRADKLTDPIHQWRMREGGENISCARLQETQSNFTDGPAKLL